ncbi:MAG: hypothetical protein A2539_07055 [Elusimicrobia bacterium RIFOXYD2_FULL_34_15]|nr:MAG: hypothetical protein A2539_07055 [Elusimicrobia bacterium RIFOXYD2_FULL_34_15]
MKSKLAILSFVLGLVSFLQLFGIEKAILAIIFGTIALKEIVSDQKLTGKNYAYSAIILGSLYILVIITFIIIKGPDMLKNVGIMR